MQNYLEAVTKVISLMKQPDSPCTNIKLYHRCYMGLFQYLLTENIEFSMDAALVWLSSKKESLTQESYSGYRGALFRLEHFLLFGNINSPCCRSEEDFFCRSGISESFFRLLLELKDYYFYEQNPMYYYIHCASTKAFFRNATQLGVSEPEAITLDVLIHFWDGLEKAAVSKPRKKNAANAMHGLMKYLYKRGDVPYCYQLALFNGNVERLKELKLSITGNAFQPSSCLESKATEFLEVLGEFGYKDYTVNHYRSDLEWYFLFLEINHLDHSNQSMTSWASALSVSVQQGKETCSLTEHRIYTVRSFELFLNGYSPENMPKEHHNEFETLPEWSRTILEAFVESKRRDGMAEKTLWLCRNAGGNFFRYLEQSGIQDAAGITPDVIKAFHNQDHNLTSKSMNDKRVKVRQLLQYMADKNLIRHTLCYAISTENVNPRTIVSVLNEEEIAAIYDYREKASMPIELRDVAMVMLGLRMGIRGIDIINLKITDFDWHNKTVSFVQSKTRKAITLPVPTDVGNSVYQYITHGRPSSSAESGNGYVFIRHQAPLIPFKHASCTCTGALRRILHASGIELEKKKGFHMTRKTFATRMLRAENRVDDISNALGHTRKESVEVYLERDEANMRRCPLSFGGVL